MRAEYWDGIWGRGHAVVLLKEVEDIVMVF